MTTNYPTSIDTFVNPTSNDSLNSPSHSQQHANLNDAMVAVQTKLGYGNANKVAIYLINETTVTSNATAIISNVFTSTYAKYLVTWQLLTTTRDALNCRFAAGGSQLNGATSYRSSWSYVGYAGATGSYDSMILVPSIPGTGSGAIDYYGELWVHSPADTSRYTMFNHNSGGSFATGADHSSFYGGGVYQATTAIDGIAFSIPTGNLTGKIRIYGLRDS